MLLHIYKYIYDYVNRKKWKLFSTKKLRSFIPEVFDDLKGKFDEAMCSLSFLSAKYDELNSQSINNASKY